MLGHSGGREEGGRVEQHGKGVAVRLGAVISIRSQMTETAKRGERKDDAGAYTAPGRSRCGAAAPAPQSHRLVKASYAWNLVVLLTPSPPHPHLASPRPTSPHTQPRHHHATPAPTRRFLVLGRRRRRRRRRRVGAGSAPLRRPLRHLHVPGAEGRGWGAARGRLGAARSGWGRLGAVGGG